MKTPASPATRLATASALVALLSALAPAGRAASTFNWTSGTTGAWDTTSTTAWSSGAAWNNGNDDTANFGSSANYQVTIAASTAISAGGLSATNSSFAVTLAGLSGSSLTLAGSAPKVGGAGNITLAIALQGSNGLTKEGSGTLRFNTAAAYSGDTVLSSTGGNGQITLGVTNGLPTATKLTTSSGTNFTMQGFSQTLAGLAGNGTVRTTSGSTSKVTVNGATTDTFSGSINDGATVGVSLGFERGGTGVTNLNGTSAYRGTTAVSGGTLSLGSNLTGTSSVTIGGGTLTSSIANVNLGLGGVSMSTGAITPRGVGSAGSFTLAANRNFTTTGGTLNFDLGAAFDQIIGSGTATFGLSNTTLALTLGSGFSYGSTYNLLQGFASGSVSSLSITGYDTANYVAILGDGTTGVLGTLSFASVPEPSSYALLLGAAVLGLAVRRRAARR